MSTLRPRVIPTLLLRGSGLVKTVKFKNERYLGDPRNAVKIFNEKEVDELVLLDIEATPTGTAPKLEFIEEIVSEAFMPVAYGGGIRSIADARRIISLGVEKIVVNTAAIENPVLISDLAEEVGTQSIVVSIDVERSLLGHYRVRTRGGSSKIDRTIDDLATEAEQRGAGELFLNSIDRDGTMEGYDTALIRRVTNRITIPLIACGGCGSIQHIQDAFQKGGAAAAAAGSFFVFKGKHRAVLINFPDQTVLDQVMAT